LTLSQRYPVAYVVFRFVAAMALCIAVVFVSLAAADRISAWLAVGP
jgi:hypothetical protein